MASDSRRSEEGERLWAQAAQLAGKADRQYANAGYLVEAAVMLDSSRMDARERAGDIFYVRALLAESIAEILDEPHRISANHRCALEASISDSTTGRSWD